MIKFVYFDVGGVALLDFSADSSKWVIMKKAMGVKSDFEEEFEKLYREYEQKELCLSRAVDSLIPVFTKKFGMTFPENFSMEKYFVDHFTQNLSLWPVIKEINKQCRIGLLTNMYVGMFEDIKNASLLPPCNWDMIIDSTVVKLQKPSSEIYAFAQKEVKVEGNEILFIDNNEKNIESAQKFGWLTFLYDPKNAEKSSNALLKYFREEVSD